MAGIWREAVGLLDDLMRDKAVIDSVVHRSGGRRCKASILLKSKCFV